MAWWLLDRLRSWTPRPPTAGRQPATRSSDHYFSRWQFPWNRRRSFGERGERAAARFLRRRGYKIVAQRDRSALGELDLVAVDGRTVVFVEVKTRGTHQAGHPTGAVDGAKQARLTRLALAYLKRHDLLECAARFDVIAVTWHADRRQPDIEHFENAFGAVGERQMFS